MTTKITADNIEQSTLDSISGGPAIANIQIANSSYGLLDDTAVSTSGGYILINGTKFSNGCSVLIGNTVATSVAFVSDTQIRAEVPAKAGASYVVYVTNPDGGTAIAVNGLTFSNTPVWATDSSLPSGSVDSAISINLSAPSDSNVVYSVAAGSSLPSGITLASNGLLSGTITGITVETTYNFTVDAIDVELQDTSRSFSITITVGDPNYKDTVLHLNADTDTWITDASTNKLAVTVAGDTRPMIFSPYNTSWSAYFDGTSDYFTIPNDVNLQLGSGDFTAEGWFNSLSTKTGSVVCFYSKGVNTTGGILLGVSSDYVFCRHTGQTDLSYNSGTGSNSNQWVHVAWVRSGNTLTIYRNGVSVASATVGFNQNDTGVLYFGSISSVASAANRYGGYISNFRTVKGTALYTGNFTPTTSPLTAITDTTLLVCQSNRFIDNSTNNFTITKFAAAKTTGFSPFTETDLVTGSAYFDGTGDYLTIPNNSAFALPGDFTIELWVNLNTNTTSVFCGNINSSGYGDWAFFYNNTAGLRFITDNSLTVLTSTYTFPLNVWTHVAVSRSGTSVKFFANGNLLSTVTNSSTNSFAGTMNIGRSNDAGLQFPGYMSNLRIVKGTAVYTEAFTPPTSPLTAITNTSLLTLQSRVSENNNRFVDESGVGHIIPSNSVISSGTESPYGVGDWSHYFDGTGDYLSVASSSAFGLGTGVFTFECWLYPTANPANGPGTIFDARSGALAEGYVIRAFNDRTIGIYTSSGSYVYSTGTITLNTWNHVAIVRTSTSTNGLTFYINGVAAGTVTVSQNLGTTWSPLIGSNYAGSGYEWNGYISNLRLVKDTAVYTSAFTPPTSPLTAITDTILLTCQRSVFIDSSTNNFTITKYGNTLATPFNPFKRTNSWSANINGGSMVSTGTAVSIPSSTGFQFGTGDFTVEFWLKTIKTYFGVIGLPTQTLGNWAIDVASDTVFRWKKTYGSTTGAIGTSSTPLIDGNWHHVAIVRSSGTTTIYFDGVSKNSGADSTNYNGTAALTVFDGITGQYQGYLADIRLVKGTAVYTSNFTPPSEPLTAISGTTLLLNGTRGGIIDYTSKANLVHYGNVKIDNTVKKYGNGSLYFDGTGDGIFTPLPVSAQVADNPLFMFGSQDFTMEFWVQFNTVSTRQAVFGQGWGSTNFAAQGGFTLDMAGNTSGKLSLAIGSMNSSAFWIQSVGSFTTGQWYHVALVRYGQSIKIYQDGVSIGSGSLTASTTLVGNMGRINIGMYENNTFSLNGYIDDLRITKGVARYTANFTPPTEAFNTR